MPRLNVVRPQDAQGEVKKIYDAIKSSFGMIPNLFKGFANSPITLQAYLSLMKLVDQGTLSEQETEVVRLTVSQVNDCNYCLAAHTMTGKMSGLSEDEILKIRKGEPSDSKHAALAAFTRKILATNGYVGDDDIAAFRAAGYSDEHIGEVVTIISQKTLSNLFNHINDTELDFPAVPEV